MRNGDPELRRPWCAVDKDKGGTTGVTKASPFDADVVLVFEGLIELDFHLGTVDVET